MLYAEMLPSMLHLDQLDGFTVLRLLSGLPGGEIWCRFFFCENSLETQDELWWTPVDLF